MFRLRRHWPNRVLKRSPAPRIVATGVAVRGIIIERDLKKAFF
jgi:hypothetical protein